MYLSIREGFSRNWPNCLPLKNGIGGERPQIDYIWFKKKILNVAYSD